LSSLDLAEWEAYSLIEPFGPLTDYWRAGLIAAMVRNVNRTRESQPIAKPEDFVPNLPVFEETDEEDDEQRAQDVAERVRSAFRLLSRVHKDQKT
jgi:hypothetical protein